jgi:hypothetical protein
MRPAEQRLMQLARMEGVIGKKTRGLRHHGMGGCIGTSWIR